MHTFVNNLVYMAVGIVGALSVIKGVGFTVGNLSCFLTYAISIQSLSTKYQALSPSFKVHSLLQSVSLRS